MVVTSDSSLELVAAADGDGARILFDRPSEAVLPTGQETIAQALGVLLVIGVPDRVRCRCGAPIRWPGETSTALGSGGNASVNVDLWSHLYRDSAVVRMRDASDVHGWRRPGRNEAIGVARDGIRRAAPAAPRGRHSTGPTIFRLGLRGGRDSGHRRPGEPDSSLRSSHERPEPGGQGTGGPPGCRCGVRPKPISIRSSRSTMIPEPACTTPPTRSPGPTRPRRSTGTAEPGSGAFLEAVPQQEQGARGGRGDAAVVAIGGVVIAPKLLACGFRPRLQGVLGQRAHRVQQDDRRPEHAGLAVGTVGGHVDGDHRLERRDLRRRYRKPTDAALYRAPDRAKAQFAWQARNRAAFNLSAGSTTAARPTANGRTCWPGRASAPMSGSSSSRARSACSSPSRQRATETAPRRHAGRFAISYTERFGVRPGMTLRSGAVIAVR